MSRTGPPSAEIEKRIDGLLAVGVAAEDPRGALSELAQVGVKLVIQRAVEDGSTEETAAVHSGSMPERESPERGTPPPSQALGEVLAERDPRSRGPLPEPTAISRSTSGAAGGDGSRARAE